MRATFGPIAIELKDGWADITEDLPEGTPLTLSRQSVSACGSFQLTLALNKGGSRPRATAVELAEMLREFAEKQDLGPSSDEIVEESCLSLAAATFRWNESVVRVWYVSDGASFAKVTYLSARIRDHAAELADCEQMVRTISFPQ